MDKDKNDGNVLAFPKKRNSQPSNDFEWIDPELLPRCELGDGSTLRIVPVGTEAGDLGEANCVVIADNDGREAVYVPFFTVDKERNKLKRLRHSSS